MLPTSLTDRWWLRAPWRDPLVAGGCFALGTVLYAVGLQPLAEHPRDVPFTWRVAVLAAMCAAQLLRACRPPLALLVGTCVAAVDVSLGANLPVLLVLGDLIFAATLYGARWVRRLLVTLTIVGPLAVGLAVLVGTGEWRFAVLAVFQIASAQIVPVWWAMSIRNHREVAAAERTRAEHLVLIADLDRRAALTAERTRMARDLHDVIAGHLSAIALQSEAVLSVAGRDPGTVGTVLRSIRENSVQALAEMRAMIGMLRADEGDDAHADRPAAPARLRDLDRLVESARSSGLRVTVSSTVGTSPLPAAVDLTAYRIFQEALTNAATHAPGAEARVSLDRTDHALTITVTNDMTQGDAAEPPAADHGARLGTGLASMDERTRALGGVFSAGPDAGRWRVRAVLPLEDATGRGRSGHLSSQRAAT